MQTTMPTPRPSCSTSLRPRREPRPPSVGQHLTAAKVRAVLALYLEPLERDVVRLRYGIDGAIDVRDVQAIADCLKIPAYVAFRALLSATAKLREAKVLQAIR